MTLNEWREEMGWTWERVARELSYLLRLYNGQSIYSNKVWRLRKGAIKPNQHEIRALCQLTDNRVDSYKEPS